MLMNPMMFWEASRGPTFKTSGYGPYSSCRSYAPCFIQPAQRLSQGSFEVAIFRGIIESRIRSRAGGPTPTKQEDRYKKSLALASTSTCVKTAPEKEGSPVFSISVRSILIVADRFHVIRLVEIGCEANTGLAR